VPATGRAFYEGEIPRAIVEAQQRTRAGGAGVVVLPIGFC
jgi:hypothetical protein